MSEKVSKIIFIIPQYQKELEIQLLLIIDIKKQMSYPQKISESSQNQEQEKSMINQNDQRKNKQNSEDEQIKADQQEQSQQEQEEQQRISKNQVNEQREANGFSSVSSADQDYQYILQTKKKKTKNLQKQIHTLTEYKGVFAVALIVICILIFLNFEQNNEEQFITKSMSNFIKEALANNQKQNPKTYLGVQQVKPYKELPLCILQLFQKDPEKQQKIESSILSQNYTNYKTIKFSQWDLSYEKISQKIHEQCSEYSIIIFVDNQLKENSFNLTNYYYQMYNMWVGYSVVKNNVGTQIQRVQIVSLYHRVWELILRNDFWGEAFHIRTKIFTIQEIRASFTNIILQLCRFNAKNTPYQHYFIQNSPPMLQILIDSSDLSQEIGRIPFQPLLSLQQNYKVDVEAALKHRYKFISSLKTILFPDLLMRSTNQVTHEQFQQLLESQQMIFLSKNHSLCDIDRLRIQKKYQISRYSSPEKQLPICICVFSYNNQQNDRARKVMRTLARQQYQNFRIVFVDDFSTDRTMEVTAQQLTKFNFPKQRVVLIKNLRKKRATYNYLNANFLHCQQNDIQIIVDGDDQLIGQQVLNFINTQYQDNPDLWFMHTIYKTTKYNEGFNILPFTNEGLFNRFGGRRFVHFISHLRTWKVKLLRSLPMGEHISPLTGGFHEINCDVAVQYGLFELSNGEKHAKYVPQMNYLYFSGYGNNDDSSFYMTLYINLHHFLLSLRPRLQPLKDLEQKWNNTQIQQIFKKDRDIQYTVIKMEDIKIFK